MSSTPPANATGPSARLQFPLDAGDRSVRREVHKTIDYPGVPVDHALTTRNWDVLKGVRVPVRPHFGVMGSGAQGGRRRQLGAAELHRRQHRQLAHRQGRDDVLSGGGAGRAPVGRRSARLAGRFRTVRHRHRVLLDRHLPAHPAQGAELGGTPLEGLDFPMLETATMGGAGLQLAQLPGGARRRRAAEIYGKSSVDLAMRDAFRKMRRFLMTAKDLTEDEAI